MKFDALGRSFDLDLTPNSNLLTVAGDPATGGAVPYRGMLAGVAGSWVRITIIDGVPTGLIWDGSEMLAIERDGRNPDGTETAIIYRLADPVVAAGAMSCGGGMPLETGAPFTSHWSANSMSPKNRPSAQYRN